jgi:hypothetical protein
MSEYIAWFLAIACTVTIIGLLLIDAYFTRKERFVDRLQSKVEGNTDATRK